MFDWCEWQLERLVRRIHFGLITRLYPELHRIQGEKDRQWALWFATEEESLWKRLLAGIAIVLIGPVIITSIAAVILSRLGWIPDGMTLIVYLLTWIGGMYLTAGVVERIRGSQIRRSCFSAMRIFGQDVCPYCGYDMAGHEVQEKRMRICPECGDAVPPLTHQRAA